MAATKATKSDELAQKQEDYTLRHGRLIEEILDGFGITTRVAEVNDRPTDIEFALEIALERI